jgi:hypothetical protein
MRRPRLRRSSLYVRIEAFILGPNFARRRRGQAATPELTVFKSSLKKYKSADPRRLNPLRRAFLI